MSDGMVVERLARLEPNWADVERRSRRLHKQHVLRRTGLALGALAAAAVLAGGAYAAARAIWGGHDMTPADIERQATTVYNDKWDVCDRSGRCTTQTGNHKEVEILPSMGVVFVLPDGHSVSIVPAAGVLAIPPEWGGPEPGARRARVPQHGATFTPLRDSSGRYVGGAWAVPLPGGGKRTITWHVASGSMTMEDSVGGRTTTTALHAGDVVPLIPGSTAGDPRSLDQAVTFDLPPGERVIIFPQLNETYIDGVNPPPMAEPLAKGEAAEYGLTAIGAYNGTLPVTASGGTWTSHLPGGLTRTISWHAGDSFVRVEDTTSAGTTTTEVPLGHELPLVPFK
jgi:hypothetical protein